MDPEFLASIGLDDEAVSSKIMAKFEEEEKGLRANRDALLKESKESQAELKRYVGIEPDRHWEYKKKLESIDEKNLMDKGEFDKVLQKKEEEWAGKNRDLENKYTTLKNQYTQEKENREILGAVGDQGDGELIMAAIRYAGLITTVDTDTGPMLRVKGIDGKDVADINALIKQMKESDKFARLFNSTQRSGGGARGSTGIKISDDPSKLTATEKIKQGFSKS